ncbi:exosortase A [Alteromonas sp. KUL106]|uniref:exosortase A n=1 Tax=Alteromonas sp. KUL106 TaxID=2480799 RepID=UPI0012E66D8B|nr:exosortase A [Alteromonas sp. KUL106]GFD66840.1 exosortase A [Alteromonas sp. KUL106]
MNNEETQDEMKQSLAGFSFANNKVFYISSLALFGLWLVFCWQGLTTVVEIWYGNEIFNHGFFIVPGAFYLIYLKRFELLSKPIQTSPLALIVIIPALLLYVIGVAGDIQLFLHAATFTLLPALIWLVIGTAAAKTILFPLVFMLFSIPVGEQLIPYLQEIAADGSVALLRLTGVPLFRSGLYIEIPQGRFLVAEACSGVSFFIASFVIGSLYAYLNLVSVKRRAIFVAISLIFPVLANIVRVYGIILIAYLTDMEHAAGADHLIYGWFFFAFVILCLLGIGEFIRQSPYEPCKIGPKNATTSVSIPAIISSIAVFASFFAWIVNISNISNSHFEPRLSTLAYDWDDNCQTTDWQPIVVDPDSEEFGFLKYRGCNVKVYNAWFSEQHNELVSDLHRLFDPERFSLSHTRSITTNGLHLSVYHVVSSSGNKLSIIRFYEVDDALFTSAVNAKIYQVRNVLFGSSRGGRLWILAANGHDVSDISDSLSAILPHL